MNDKIIEEYANIIPEMIREGVKALDSKTRWAIVVALSEKEKYSFSELMNLFKVNQSTLNTHLDKLEIGGVIRNYYKRQKYSQTRSYYSLTNFGTKILDNLFKTIEHRPIDIPKDMKGDSASQTITLSEDALEQNYLPKNMMEQFDTIAEAIPFKEVVG